MTICINGQERQIPERTTISGLLAMLELPADAVAVEVNSAIIRRAHHAHHGLNPNDRVEIVTFVGGG